MRALCPLACLAACTFSSPEPSTEPEPEPGAAPDAAAGADAAEPGWMVVDTLAVPVTGAMVMSVFVPQSGVRYRLRASGTFTIQSPEGTPADAEYWGFSPLMDGVTGVDIGLAVNDPSVDTVRTPKWGPYDPTHVYEVDWTGNGARITAQLHDGNFSNNTGSLRLEILALR